VSLRASSNGESISVPLGTEIFVDLAASTNPPYSWTEVTSSAPETLRDDTARQYAGNSTATLKAVATGTATVSATNNPNCDACGPPSEVWEVTIHIV